MRVLAGAPGATAERGARKTLPLLQVILWACFRLLGGPFVKCAEDLCCARFDKQCVCAPVLLPVAANGTEV